MSRTLRLSPIVDLKSLGCSGEIVAFGVSMDGLIYLAIASYGRKYRIVSLFEDEIWLNVEVYDEDFKIHHVQPLPRDELLMVGLNGRNRNLGCREKTGRVYKCDGTLVRDFPLGYGINTVQTTLKGIVWTSYFDEGIFGSGQDPIGESGLVAWNSQGKRLFSYQPNGELEAMADCYALNVASDDDVWCYYYTSFPLVHIRHRRIEDFWRVPVKGSSAFAISDSVALFQGGYKNHETFYLLDLKQEAQAAVLAEIQLEDERGNILKADRITARGSSIYILRYSQIYRLEVGMAA